MRTRSRHTLSLIELDTVISQPRALPDQIYATLKHQILTCQLRPDQRIPEKELCAKVNVSMTPVREALNRLAAEGLVSLVPYRGYTVTGLEPDDVRELCELRVIVEGDAAALAAERATSKDIERLTSLAELRYQPGNRQTYEDYLRANSAFHLALVQCTRNHRLESLVMSVLDQLQRPLYLGLDVGNSSETATAEHLEVVDAVRLKDSAKAKDLARRNAAQAEERILKVIEAYTH